VDSLTLSKEQKKLAEERIKAAGLEHKIRIHLMDYRDIPANFKHAFDAFISIEMIEHVGPRVSVSVILFTSYSSANNVRSITTSISLS
jgi:cyclopropane fatty-acyl-phospholipid synthase-like methyltransferase